MNAAINMEKTLLTNHSYNEILKNRFHTQAKKVLKADVEALGLQEGQYDIRSNKAGIACSGEVTLHADNIYIQIGQDGPKEILYRTCKGRKDYCGGSNNFMSAKELASNFSRAISAFKALMS